MDALLAYLGQHPAVAALLGALLIMFVWTVIKGLLKLALMSGVVLAISFFVTNQRATEAWMDQAGDAAQTAAAAVMARGAQAIDELAAPDAALPQPPALPE